LEVETLLKDFDLLHQYGEVQQWYNGYNFGGRFIYNPWPTVNFLISDVNKVNGDVLKFDQVLKQVNDEVNLFNYDVIIFNHGIINVIAYVILKIKCQAKKSSA
jgi:hypothetical protein